MSWLAVERIALTPRHYDISVKHLMKRYRLHEVEVVTGIILRNPHRRTATEEDIEVAVKRTHAQLVDEVRVTAAKFWQKKKNGNKSALDTEQIYALAAYQITYISAVREDVEEKLGIKEALATLYNESVMPSGIPVEDNVRLGSQDATPQVTPASAQELQKAQLTNRPLISFPWVFWRELCSLPNVAHPQET